MATHGTLKEITLIDFHKVCEYRLDNLKNFEFKSHLSHD